MATLRDGITRNAAGSWVLRLSRSERIERREVWRFMDYIRECEGRATLYRYLDGHRVRMTFRSEHDAVLARLLFG